MLLQISGPQPSECTKLRESVTTAVQTCTPVNVQPETAWQVASVFSAVQVALDPCFAVQVVKT